jgi:peptide/nickel transport system permease protein
LTGFVLGRLLLTIPLLFGISLLAFGMIRLAPGDPADFLLGQDALSPDQAAGLRVELGLDEPLPVQYVKTVTALATGQLRSFKTRQLVWDVIAERLPTTLIVGALALLIGIPLGVFVGMIQSLRPYGRFDDSATVLSLLGFAAPQFWLALMAILIFAVRLHWLPSSGIRPLSATGYNLVEMAPYLIMPSLVLAAGLLASNARYTRAAMLETLNQDYMRTARAKGLKERVVIVRHGLRNSLLSVITLLGFQLPILIGGAVTVETIFSLPGVGRLAIDSVFGRDYPVLLTVNLLSASAVVLGNLLSDVLYGFADPRIRLA